MQSVGSSHRLTFDSVVGIVPLFITEICTVVVDSAAKFSHSIEIRSALKPAAVTFNPKSIILPLTQKNY